MRSYPEIVDLAAGRSVAQQPLITQMREMRDRYNGDVVYAWTAEMTGGRDMPPLTPHLIGEGIDQMALRAASVLPSLYAPAVNPALEKGPRSPEYASIRRRAMAATFHESKFPLLARRFFRHLTGYALTSLMVEPDFTKGIPKIRVRNPLQTFPDPRASEDLDDPLDCVYIYGLSAAHARKLYPQLRVEAGGPIPATTYDDQLWDFIEYVDADEIVTGLAGKRRFWEQNVLFDGSLESAIELSRVANRAERFPGIAMGRVTLDKISSSLAHVVGLVDWQAKLALLDVVASEKAIFPDLYIIGQNGRNPRLQDGRWHDGRSGKANILLDVEGVGQLRSDPGQSGKMAIDRMERNARVGMGLVPQMGGETYGALRTGRAIDALGGFAVDPKVQELQETAQAWLPSLMGAVSACYTGYWGRKSFSMYSGYAADRGQVTFVPSRHLAESDAYVASYPIAGADAQQTNITLSQMLGTEAISLELFRELHPWIPDSGSEAAKLLEEKLERAAEQAILQGAVSGQLPLIYLARIAKHVRQGHDIHTATEKADAEIKAEQAAAPPEPEAPAGAIPGQQPGLGMPDPAAQQPVQPLVQEGMGPTSNQEGLRELMNALAAGNRQVA